MEELASLASELVAIDSINPSLIEGAAGEAEIARLVARWLEEAGLEVEVVEPRPGRPSVVGVARGAGGGRSLMLNAHLDTVGIEGMERPFEPRVEDGRLHGRGSYDMKGSLAAIMLAGREARRRELRGDVIVAAVADEELGSVGTKAVLERWRPDAAIVAEPTGMRTGVAHKGFVAFQIETIGRAAHGSRPDLGVDAIAMMGRVLVAIEALDRGLRANPTHPLLGSGSLHASIISGGQELSSYPERCVLEAERRTVPRETAAQVDAELRALVDLFASEDPAFSATARTVFSREPFEVDEGEPIVELVRRHAGGAEPAGLSYWADSALIAEAGIPTVLFGPDGEGAHAVVEWVDLASLERCLEVYLAVAAELCA